MIGLYVREKMKRKEILPAWIRFFSWIFLIFCITPVIGIISVITKSEFEVAALGIEVNEPHAQLPLALYLYSIMFLASVVAYGILWGKKWAVDLGIVYGIIALFTSLYASIDGLMMRNEGVFHFSLDPLLLIPFVIILLQKRKEWRAFPIDGLHYTSNQREPVAGVNSVTSLRDSTP